MIFANSLPGFKGLVSVVRLPAHVLCHVTAFVAAFVLHRGTMSCSQAAAIFHQHRRNVATLTRFLSEIGHSSDLLVCVRSASVATNFEASLEQLVTWYDLRWQIEVMF